MAEELFIPKLGQTVEEVTLINWLVEDGAKVEAGQDVLEVETDKAIFAVPAPASGILHHGPYQKGEVIPVLTVVGAVGKAGEKVSLEAQGPKQETPAGAQSGLLSSSVEEPILPADHAKAEKSAFASPRARRLAHLKGVDLAKVLPSGGGGTRVREKDVLAYLESLPHLSPVARKIAAERGLDVSSLEGSGPGGWVMKQDVLAASSTVPQQVQAAIAPAKTATDEVLERTPLTGVRGVIAERMSVSVHTTARVTLTSEVDASALAELRERFRMKVSETWGFTPSYNDFLGLIVARALKGHPYMNARLSADGKAIETLRQVNIGLAVDTPRGLLVPVIHNADRLGLRQFGQRSRELADKARQGRCLPDELSGGTFTITNLGMYEIDAFTPVINLPEIAILGVGRIVQKPVFENGEVTVGRRMILSLVFDHRLTDGAPAARFLQQIKRLVEDPFLLLE